MPYKNENVRRAYMRKYLVNREFDCKLKVLSHYGKNGKLQCCWPDCDVTDIDVLTLDHIYNDGHKEGRSRSKYAQVIKQGLPEDRYQTLCWNHQFKKEINRRRDLMLSK